MFQTYPKTSLEMSPDREISRDTGDFSRCVSHLMNLAKDAKFMASVSKDHKVAIWHNDTALSQYPSYKLFTEIDLQQIWRFQSPWGQPCFVQFNDENSHLLVTGHLGGLRGDGSIYELKRDENGETQFYHSFPLAPSLMCAQWYDSQSILCTSLSAGGPNFSHRLILWYLPIVPGHTPQPVPLFNTQRWLNSGMIPHFLLLSNCLPERFAENMEVGDKLLIYAVGRSRSTAYGHNFLAFNVIRKGEVDRIVREFDHGTAHSVEESTPELDSDFEMDVGGFIIGLKLSSDENFLVVNVRSPLQETSQNPPDAVEQDDESLLWSPDPKIRIIDLCTLTLLPIEYMGAKNPRKSIWYRHGDACNHFVAAGSSDNYGYLWSREYQCLMKTQEHNMGVNCAVFNPVDPEVLVTASDDHSVKVWMSKQRMKALKHRGPERRLKTHSEAAPCRGGRKRLYLPH